MNRRKIPLIVTLVALASLALLDASAGTVRSASAKTAFYHRQACPATATNKPPCPGFIIDHIVALDCGGSDAPENMQWLTVAAAKAKDKTERDGATCAHRTNAKQ